ncbi:MAG: hypothetical protein CK425_05220 [Parachlamydia sp.]|nr:MAG: hypothetical protein CK425_05220 [Parachlamydia sp.]
MYSVHNSIHPALTGDSSYQLILDRINALLDEKKYTQATERFVNFIATINEAFDPLLIENAYALLFRLIGNADSLYMLQASIDRLLNISSGTRFTLCQQNLAIKLAKWHFNKGKKQNEQSEKIKYFTIAIRYVGKARCFPCDSFHEIDLLASRIFRVCAIQFSSFQDRLEYAVSNESKQDVLHVVHNLKERFSFCCAEEQDLLIKQFYKQISAIYNRTFRTWGQARLENCGLTTLFFPMESWLNKKLYPSCFLISSYRQQLRIYREEFATRYKEVENDPAPSKVRSFQKIMSAQFNDLLKRLIKDTFAIVGDPPCLFDCRVMGSTGKEEPCPRSDIEWFLLIEDAQHVPYFLRLARTLELQVISLGEDAALDLPVFTCIGVKHQSGLHIDSGGNPATDSGLIGTPKSMAKYQSVTDYQPCSLANTLRKTVSLEQNSPKLFEDFQDFQEATLKEIFPDSNESFSTHHTFQLLSARLEQFEEVWKTPFETPTIHIKVQFTELLNHFLNDLSLYFNVQTGNTLDLVDDLQKKEVFTNESAELLREAVAYIYAMRVGLHVQYEEQKEEIVLEKIPEAALKQLKKIYCLILRPIYRRLKKCLDKPEFFHSYFSKINLLKWALSDEVIDPATIEQIKPIVAHLAEHLALKTITQSNKSSLSSHRKYYEYLSSLIAAEPLRTTYMDALISFKEHSNIANLIPFLANIPNRNGVRQAARIEQLELQTAILSMTTTVPEGENPVFVRCRGMHDGRYLRQEVANQIVDQSGDLKRQYQSSAHRVAFATYDNFYLHFKQTPNHALMEYAVYALIGRFEAQLAPPVELARFEVQNKVYPVLISPTVDGRALGENDRCESSSFTWGCLLAILTKPGDGRFSNYLKERSTERLVIIDEEMSFFEPLTCESQKKYQVHFTSALFCLHPQPLDRSVLMQFIGLEPSLILESWMKELINIDRSYQDMQLFSQEEQARLYKDGFKATLLLRSGVITTLLVQFYHLQDCLRHALESSEKELYPLDLLRFLITIRESEKQSVSYVYNSYQAASRQPFPKQRLACAVNRDIGISMTSLQADGISFGKLPSLQEILSREEYAPEKAQEELFLFALCNTMPGITVGKSQGKPYIKATFKNIHKKGQPDIDLQQLLLRALAFFFGRATPKPSSITLVYCAVLDLTSLKPFLHEGLEFLNLSGSSIEQNAIEEIEKNCPNLKYLYLNGCRKLKNFQKTSYYIAGTYLNFPNLKVLQLKRCLRLESIQLQAPVLEELSADRNRALKTVFLLPLKLYLKGNFDECILLNLENIKQAELSKWLPRSTLLDHMESALIALHDNDPTVNLQNSYIGDLGAKTLSKALAMCTSLTEINLKNNKNIFYDSSFKEIFKALRGCTALRILNLAGNTISAKAIEVLIPVIEQQSSLTALNLAGSKISSSQIHSLSKALNKHALTKLNLKYCNIGTGAATLNKLFSKTNSLVAINLSSNQIGSKSAEELAQALVPHRSLTSIKLSNNSINTGKALAALTQLFLSLPDLQTVHLAQNKCYEGALIILMERLSSLASLTSLNLDGNLIGKRGIEVFSNIINSNHQLKGSGELMHLFRLLGSLPDLQTLVLSREPFGDNGFSALAHGLSNCSSLQSITLNGTDHAVYILKALDAHPNIISLNLSNKYLHNHEGAVLIQLMKKLKHLESLELENSHVDSKITEALCKLLVELRSLTTLKLPHHEMTPEGFAALCEAISNNPSLSTLSLSSCALDEDQLEIIIKSLQKHSKLTSLDLSNNHGIGVAGMKALAQVLTASAKFSSLNLARLAMNLEKVKILGQALDQQIPHSSSLSLDLSSNDIGNEGVRALIAGQSIRDRYGSLILDNNFIQAEGIKLLCGAMVRNNSIKTISLNDNPIGDNGAAYLSALIAHQTELASLHLSNISISNKGLRLIAKALQGKSSLMNISMIHNDKITEQGIAALRKALTSHTCVPPTMLMQLGFKESTFD